MAQKPTPHWQPVSMMPLIAHAIDGMVDSADEQQITLRSVRERPYVLDDALVARMLRLYTEQQDDLSMYEEQLRRWQHASLTDPQRREVDRLRTQLVRLRSAIAEILTIAEEIKSQTIERVLAKSDIEVGLEALLKKQTR